MVQPMTKRLVMTSLVMAACSTPAGPGPNAGDDVQPSMDAPAQVVDPCASPVVVPTVGRALDLMPRDALTQIAARMPCVSGPLRDIVESTRTLWYDKHSLTPGYQDSFGDNVVAPIGMRPNTIDPGLIDLAVPGGHALIFSEIGKFHFPFGNPIGAADPVTVVNFWRLPDDGSTSIPVVWWKRDPNEYTHRVEWMFPKGTVFGEVLFLDEGGELHPVEIRTRTRTLVGWDVDAFRPFPHASDLADAIVARRGSRASAPLDALVARLRDDTTLEPFELAATHFASAFATRSSGIDRLPGLTGADADFIHELLRTTEFRSARGAIWKAGGGRSSFAASAAGTGSIVPRGYNAAALEVSETSCDSCHRDAGRPFMTWYDNILAYGELWGNDEIFTWHPFTLAKFVDADGAVVNFNYDQREIRPDMIGAGLIAPYVPAQHTADRYKRIVREWTDFQY